MAGLKLQQHKVFTKDGWKGYEDYLLGSLRIGDDIIVFNPNTKVYDWSPLIEIDFCPFDRKVLLSILGKTIEFGKSQSWLIDVQYPPDLKLNNKYNLVDSSTLSHIDSNRESFGVTWNKHIFYIQAGVTDLDLDLGLSTNILTPYKESNFTLIPVNNLDSIPTWSPLTLYYNALVRTEELILLVGCAKHSSITSGNNYPYALSKTLITSLPINLLEFDGLMGEDQVEIQTIELINISSSECYVCNKTNGIPIGLPTSIPYKDRELYEIRNSLLSVPNKLVCTFKVKNLLGTISPNESFIRTFTPSNTPLPSPTPFPINPSDIVTKSMGNVSGGYLQLDNMSYVPSIIKVRWDSLIDIPIIEVDWQHILNKPVFKTTWDEIERRPTTFPTSWELISNKPTSFSTTWEAILDKPQAFPPSSHAHSEYALKSHTHTVSDFPSLNLVIKQGDNISLLNNNVDFITLQDITSDLIKTLLKNPNVPGGGLDADLLGGFPAGYFTNANNITTGVIGAYRLPLFSGGDVYSLINPTNLLLSITGVVPGIYTKLTVNDKGRILFGDALVSSDIPALDASKITTGVFNPLLLPLASFTARGAVILSNSYLDIGSLTVPTSKVINDVYDITQTLIPLSQKGVPNGVATLNSFGVIPTDQLPNTLDEVIFVETFLGLPTIGQENYIYVVKNSQRMYIWDGLGFKSTDVTSVPKLTTARNITITGDASWEVQFDGSQNVTSDLILSNTSVIPGQYTKVTVDQKGRVLNGTTLITNDLPIIDGGSF
jgi:hypothetical protein